MTPGNLSNNLLDNCVFGPRLGKRAHIQQVGSGKPLHFGKRRFQVAGESFDYLRASAFALLTKENILPYLPVEQYQLPIDSKRRSRLRGANTLFDFFEKVV